MNTKEVIIEELKKYYINTNPNKWINFFSFRNALINKLKTEEGIKILISNEYGLLGNLIYEIKDNKKLIKELSKIEKEICEYYYYKYGVNHDTQNIPKVLSNNKELAFKLIYEDPDGRKWLKDFSPKIRNNKEYMLEAVKHDGYALQYASKTLQNDKEIVLEAIKEDHRALKCASDELKNNKEFILEAVKRNGFALKYVPKALQNDKEIVIEAIKEDKSALEYAS